MELAATEASMAEVDWAAASIAAERLKLRVAAGTALASGEQGEQAVTRVLQQSSEVMLGRLEELRGAREALRTDCRDRYQASRIHSQQMETAVKWVTAQAEAKAASFIRNEEVDRYMSRREWLKREGQRQKISDE